MVIDIREVRVVGFPLSPPRVRLRNLLKANSERMSAKGGILPRGAPFKGFRQNPFISTKKGTRTGWKLRRKVKLARWRNRIAVEAAIRNPGVIASKGKINK